MAADRGNPTRAAWRPEKGTTIGAWPAPAPARSFDEWVDFFEGAGLDHAEALAAARKRIGPRPRITFQPTPPASQWSDDETDE